jgi:hypothetical protein
LTLNAATLSSLLGGASLDFSGVFLWGSNFAAVFTCETTVRGALANLNLANPDPQQYSPS